MKGLNRGERPKALIRVRDELRLLEGFLARADRLSEPVLIEFRRLRLPPTCRDFFRGDCDRLDARFAEWRSTAENTFCVTQTLASAPPVRTTNIKRSVQRPPIGIYSTALPDPRPTANKARRGAF